MAVLDEAVRCGAQAVDVEIESAEAAQERLHQFRGRAQVIVSYHNFEATPALDTVVARMMRVTADGYKIVTTARKPSDNIRVLAAARALPNTGWWCWPWASWASPPASSRRFLAALSPMPRRWWPKAPRRAR